MSEFVEVGFPISATASAVMADGTAFVIAVGGGGASKTGIKNGYVIFKASSDGLEEIARGVDKPDQLLCACGCFDEKENCVYFAYGCRHTCEILRVTSDNEKSYKVTSVLLFDAFPERNVSDDDDFNPHEVTAVDLMVNVKKDGFGSCIVGNSSGSLAVWEIDMASGTASSIGPLPNGSEESEDSDKDENKVKCISRFGFAVAAVTLGDGLCRLWDCDERTLKHTWHVEDFGLDKTSRPLMRFCCLTDKGSHVMIAAASRNMKAKNTGCWIAIKAIESAEEKPVVIPLKETKTLASCSIIEHEEDFVVALGNTDADALGFMIKENKATCTAAKRNCHGFVTTATNCIQLPDKNSVLLISAGTDGSCRVHHPGKNVGSGINMKTVGIILAVLIAIISVYFVFLK